MRKRQQYLIYQGSLKDWILAGVSEEAQIPSPMAEDEICIRHTGTGGSVFLPLMPYDIEQPVRNG